MVTINSLLLLFKKTDKECPPSLSKVEYVALEAAKIGITLVEDDAFTDRKRRRKRRKVV